MNLLKEIENEQVAKLTAGKEIPDFQPGDTLIVNVKLVEGERTRVQAYEGVCIGRAGSGLNENFTVRLSALFADDRLDRGRAPRQSAPRQAVLPARPPRKIRAHHRAAGPHRRGRRRQGGGVI
jgi:hypothetical protein